MDLWSTLKVLVRRWYVVLPLFVLVVIALVMVPPRVPVEHRASASLLLVPPALGSNPYLSFDSTLLVTAAVLAESMNTPAVSIELARLGAGSYSVTPHVDRSPLLFVVADHSRADVAQRTVDAVTGVLVRELDSRQQSAGAPSSTWIRLVVVSKSGSATRVTGNQKRAVAGVAAVGVAVIVGAALLTDRLDAWRRRHRRHRAVDVTSSVEREVEVAERDGQPERLQAASAPAKADEEESRRRPDRPADQRVPVGDPADAAMPPAALVQATDVEADVTDHGLADLPARLRSHTDTGTSGRYPVDASVPGPHPGSRQVP